MTWPRMPPKSWGHPLPPMSSGTATGYASPRPCWPVSVPAPTRRAGRPPSPEEVAAFLADYEDARARRFTGEQQVAAAAAATWVMAYNARCVVCLEQLGSEVEAGYALAMLDRHRDV